MRQEESIFDEGLRTSSLVDDAKLTRTKEYTRTIDLLRLLHNALVKLIEAWQHFEAGEIQYFEMKEHLTLRKTWEAYLAGINKDMAELRFLGLSLHQRIEMFDKKRGGVSYVLSARLSVRSC